MAGKTRDKHGDEGPGDAPAGGDDLADDGLAKNEASDSIDNADEEPTKVLTGDDKKRYKSMHGALKRIERKAARQTDADRKKPTDDDAPDRPETSRPGTVSAPKGRDPTADELASGPNDLPDAVPPEVPGLDSPSLTKQLRTTPNTSGMVPVNPDAVTDLGSRPTKRTIRSQRPALAGTGSTESYSDKSRKDIRAEIEAAREQRASSPEGPRVVVRVDPGGLEDTWVSGATSHVPRPRVQRCILRKRAGTGYVIERDGGKPFALPRSRMLAVAIGVIIDYPGPGEETPMVDIVTNWGSDKDGPVVMRFNANEAPLRRLFPTIRGHIAAVSALVIEMADGTTAKRLPASPKWPGPPFTRYESEDVMNLALYGSAKIQAT